MLVLCVPMEMRHSPLSSLPRYLSTLTHSEEKEEWEEHEATVYSSEYFVCPWSSERETEL